MTEPKEDGSSETTATTSIHTIRRHIPAQLMTRALIVMWVSMATFSLFVGPALAQSDTCSGQLLTTVQNATTWLTVAGPTVGSANAGYNMVKASATNKSGDQKQFKQNIRTSLLYGFGAGMLTAIINLITRWGPMTTC